MSLTKTVPSDREIEKRKNVRLALGVAATGVLGFIVLYVVVFAVFVFSPWLIPRLLPFPALSEQVAGIEGKLLIFSKELNFRRASRDNMPGERTTLSIYDGSAVSEPEDIAPFHSLYATGKKVYLFSKGGYRFYDGAAWSEVRTPALGNTPQGAADGGTLWVLSSLRNRPVLNLITGNGTKEIPLPEDEGNIRVCSSRLVATDGAVHLFWQNGHAIFWSRFNGESWRDSETFESEGGYDAIAFSDKVFLFSKRRGEERPTALWIYDGTAWSKPFKLPVGGFSLDVIPAVFKGKLVLFEHGFFSEKLYYVDEQGTIAGGPIYIRRPSVLPRHAGRLAALVVSANVVYFLLIYIISLVILRIKRRTWTRGTQEYEFASLFRRFLAYFLDILVIAVPTVLGYFYFSRDDMFGRNPFKFLELIFCAALSMIVGGFLYHSLVEGLCGKTIGKKLCGIIVLNEEFEKCSLARGFVRNALRIIDALFYYLVAAVSLSATTKWQRLGDIAAGTVVVRDLRLRKRR